MTSGANAVSCVLRGLRLRDREVLSMFTALLLAASLATAAPAAPAPAPADRPIARYLSHAVVRAEPAFERNRQPAPAKDSLKNGAVIGAIVGGIVTGAGIGLLCHAFNDTDEPQCWKAALLWAGIGAGGGAAIGAGVDALFTRRFALRATVRF